MVYESRNETRDNEGHRLESPVALGFRRKNRAMARNDIVLQLTPEQGETAMTAFTERTDLREFGCRVLGCAINAMIDVDARSNSRNGYRGRVLRTSAGEPRLRAPKLRRSTYCPEALPERRARVKTSMVTLARGMYVAALSTLKVERAAEQLAVVLPGQRRPRRSAPGCWVPAHTPTCGSTPSA